MAKYSVEIKNRKKLIKKADKLWAELIKKRDGFKCQRCHSESKQLNSCHFYSRARKSTRWDLRNGVCLCVGCHFWGHQNPLEFSLWFIKWAGTSTVNYLQVKKMGKVKTSIFNLEIIIKELEDE